MVGNMSKEESEIYNMIKKMKLSSDELKYYLREIKKSRVDTRTYTIGKSKVKFGVISDTHIGSKYYDSSLMEHAVRQFNKEGVDFVIHAGDIIEGLYPNRSGQVYELEDIGIDAQLKHAIKEMKKVKQPLYFITGNHDFTAKKIAGIVIGYRIEEKVKNAKFLGEDYGRLILKNGIKIDVVHPYDGTSYALSYKVQKRIDSMEGGSKPHLLFVGNYHKAEYLFYRNIHTFQAGTLQSQTPFMRGKGISAHKGFWIVELYSNKNGITKITPSFYPSYD